MRSLALFLGSVALMACQASTSAESRQGPEQGIATCLAAKSAVRERLEAQHSACTEDSDCVLVADVWLGCGGWQNVGTPVPKDAERAVLEACTGIPSRGLRCADQVGACVGGHCQGRPRQRTDCDAATSTLIRRASAPAACQNDVDCSEKWIAGNAYPVSARFEVDAAKELHGFSDSCDEGARARLLKHDTSTNAPRCVAKACALVPSTLPTPRFEWPSLVDRTCVVNHLAGLPTVTKAISGRVGVKFVVGANGRPGAFEFVGSVPEGLSDRIFGAIVGCTWNPARRDGLPINAWVVLPLDFH